MKVFCLSIWTNIACFLKCSVNNFINHNTLTWQVAPHPQNCFSSILYAKQWSRDLFCQAKFTSPFFSYLVWVSAHRGLELPQEPDKSYSQPPSQTPVPRSWLLTLVISLWEALIPMWCQCWNYADKIYDVFCNKLLLRSYIYETTTFFGYFQWHEWHDMALQTLRIFSTWYKQYIKQHSKSFFVAFVTDQFSSIRIKDGSLIKIYILQNWFITWNIFYEQTWLRFSSRKSATNSQ